MLKTLPEDIWEIIEEIRESGEDSRLIAESEDELTAVYVEASPNRNNAYINVTEGGEIIYYEIVIGEEDCIEAVSKIYDTLFSEESEEPVDEVISEFEEEEEEIEFREQEMKDAAEDFISIMIKGAFKTGSVTPAEMAENLVDAVAKSLYRKGYDIYRPMFLQDEETEDVEYCEFPYSQIS